MTCNGPHESTFLLIKAWTRAALPILRIICNKPGQCSWHVLCALQYSPIFCHVTTCIIQVVPWTLWTVVHYCLIRVRAWLRKASGLVKLVPHQPLPQPTKQFPLKMPCCRLFKNIHIDMNHILVCLSLRSVFLFASYCIFQGLIHSCSFSAPFEKPLCLQKSSPLNNFPWRNVHMI